MFAQETVGLYTVLLALIVVIGLPIAAFAVKRVSVGPIKMDLQEVKEVVQETHKAVNNVDDDEPKLIDQVRELRTEIAAVAKLVGAMQANDRVRAVALAQIISENEVNGDRIEQTAKLLRTHMESMDERLEGLSVLAQEGLDRPPGGGDG